MHSGSKDVVCRKEVQGPSQQVLFVYFDVLGVIFCPKTPKMFLPVGKSQPNTKSNSIKTFQVERKVFSYLFSDHTVKMFTVLPLSETFKYIMNRLSLI